jgi:hypothetical protein
MSSDENAEEAEGAVTGRYFETGAKLMTRWRPRDDGSQKSD